MAASGLRGDLVSYCSLLDVILTFQSTLFIMWGINEGIFKTRLISLES